MNPLLVAFAHSTCFSFSGQQESPELWYSIRSIRRLSGSIFLLECEREDKVKAPKRTIRKSAAPSFHHHRLSSLLDLTGGQSGVL